MRRLRTGILPLCLLAALLSPTLNARAEQPSPGSEGAVGRQEDANAPLAGELRRIHREIAALRADLDKPGLQEVFSGLGYILGLFGVAAFVASRRKGP